MSCVCVLEFSVYVDMSVCVDVVSAWLHHGVVHFQLPALSSKLYVTNSASRTHKVIHSTSLSHDSKYVNGMEQNSRCIQCHFHVRGNFHGDEDVGFFFSFCHID